MAGEFQNLSYALKTIYPNKALDPMINEEAPFRARLASGPPAGAKVTEGDVKFNGVLGLPQNVGQILDGEELFDAGERTEVQFNLRPTIFQGTMQIGWLTRRAANSGNSAFSGGELKRRTDELTGNLGKYIESTYVGTAGNGIRGYLEKAGEAGGLTLSQAIGTSIGVRLLRTGMKISVRDGTTITNVENANMDGVRILTINPTTRLITLAGTPTYTDAEAGDVLIVVSKATATLTALYANGIRNLVDDGTIGPATIHGVDRTTAANVKLKSYVSSNSGTLRDLTEKLLMRACSDIRDTSGKRPQEIWCSPGQAEKYIEFVAPDRRRAVAGGTYDKATGYKDEQELVHFAPGGVALRFNVSFDCIPRELFLLNWDTFFHYNAQPMQWVDDDSMLHLAIGTTGTHKASWVAYMASMENIGCDMPCANGVIRDLKDPVLGDV